MRRKALFASLIIAAAAFAAAQSSEYLDGLVSSEAVTVAQASYLVLVASDRLGEEADQASAFARLQELGWAPKALGADDPIRYASFAYILMRAFEIKGGIMYSLFPSPRYAYRELVAGRYIQDRADPQGVVGGPAAIRALSRVMDAARSGK